MNRRRAGAFLLLFAVGWTFGLMIRPGPQVRAQTPIGCTENYFQVEYLKDTSRRGVRVSNPGMKVHDGDISCVRISSIGIIASDGNFAETGWYEDPTGELSVCPPASLPRVLMYAVIGYNVWGCAQNTDYLVGGDWWNWKLYDQNVDTVWEYYWAGDLLGTYNLTFSQGIPVDNGERHIDPGDSSRADFDGLQYSSGSCCWIDWEGPLTLLDSDNDFKGCNYNNTHTRVIPNSESC